MSGIWYKYSAARRDPMKGYNFRVTFTGKRKVARAGFKKVSGIDANTELITIREGGRSDYAHKAIKYVEYEPFVFERGMSQDLDVLRAFAQQFDVMQGGMMRTTDDNLLDITIEVLDRNGSTVLRTIKLQGCFITKYTSGELDAMSSENLIETITVEARHVDVNNS